MMMFWPFVETAISASLPPLTATAAPADASLSGDAADPLLPLPARLTAASAGRAAGPGAAIAPARGTARGRGAGTRRS
jgi:hypothetical protein